MSIRHIERLYVRMIEHREAGSTINESVRSQIFHHIMTDVERIQKKLKHVPPGSREHQSLDDELRQLMLKEIQVIIDDYIIARENGTLDRWHRMFGDISSYIRNYYQYRTAPASPASHSLVDAYGFFNQEELVHDTR